jgi:hypothetical protein
VRGDSLLGHPHPRASSTSTKCPPVRATCRPAAEGPREGDVFSPFSSVTNVTAEGRPPPAPREARSRAHEVR